MTRKIYRTAQGKIVDLGRLQLQNESVRAVGNMNVNARGDLIDSKNSPIETRKQQVDRSYRKQTAPNAKAPNKSNRSARSAEVPVPPEDFDDDFELPSTTQQSVEVQPEEVSGGLAAAIARARQVKQEPLKTPQQTAQHQAGVTKL